VVIADDESLIRMSLREMLTGLGYLVVGEVGDGRSAVQVARELRPDLVIMDVRMPVMDGLDAARILWEERVSAVLVLTAYSHLELVGRARAAGVMGYVVKPFRRSNLVPAIEVALERYRAICDLRDNAEVLEEALETRELLDLAKRALMEDEGLAEAEAFQRIQQTSMNDGRLIREVSADVVRAHAGLDQQ
jgi:response regulator NasT